MFFDHKQPTPKKTDPRKIDKQFARELRSICESVSRRQKWKLTTWANEFRLQREQDQVTPQAVQEVLDWYGPAAKTIKAPSVYNASHFRKHFGWLSDLMKKDRVVSIEISEDAKTIAGYLNHYHWPKNAKQHLALVAQITMDSAKQFRNEVKALITKADPKSAKFKFMNRLVCNTYYGEAVFPTPYYFAKEWLTNIWTQYGTWKDWSGDIVSLAWNGDLRSKAFQKYMGNVLRIFDSYTKMWNELIEELAK